MSEDKLVSLLTEIRDHLSSIAKFRPPVASEAAIQTSYQVLARILATGNQLIWMRTTAFITINGAAVTALQALGATIGPLLRIVLPIAGGAYAVLWYLSLKRAWAYTDMHVRLMRAHEAALGLGDLGTYTHGQGPAEASKGGLGGVPASKFAYATAGLFIACYVLLAGWAIYAGCRNPAHQSGASMFFPGAEF